LKTVTLTFALTIYSQLPIGTKPSHTSHFLIWRPLNPGSQNSLLLEVPDRTHQ
jgi:hypothetical protein